MFDTDLSSGRLVLLFIALAVVFAFEFVNGFHDTANAVATVIYTRSLRPWFAVIWSGFWNFLGVSLGGIAVAMSIIKLLPVELLASSGSGAGLAMVLALLSAAILWNLGTWYFGLPASSSHTLIGAIVGVGLANSLMPGHVFGTGVNWKKVQEIGISLVVSPLFGLTVAALLLLLLKKLWKSEKLHRAASDTESPPLGIRATLIATCTGVSFAHGSNDGQKGVGLVMLILIGILPADYALNTRYDTQQFQSAVALTQDMEKNVRDAYGGPGMLAANADVADGVTTESKVIEDLSSIRHSFEGKASVKEIPVDERWGVRTRIMRVDQNLGTLEKEKGAKVDKARLDTLKKQRGTLRSAIDYAPRWVLIGVALALGLGTMIGWKRIVVTVGEKIGKSHLTYSQGASAELVAAATIGLAGGLGLPVSTTHVLSSGIAGTMLAQKSGLQRSTVRNIALAWVLTLPVATLLSGGLFLLFSAIIPAGTAQAATARVDATTIQSSDPDSTQLPQVVVKDALRIKGSNTIGAELMPRMAEAFFIVKGATHIERRRGAKPTSWLVSGVLPGEREPLVISIEAEGSQTAMTCLADKTCDIGMSSRRATPEEAKAIEAVGGGNVLLPGGESIVALDGIAVIVNAQSAGQSITKAELAKLYTGELTELPALGRVALLSRDERSGTFETFRSLVLSDKALAPSVRRLDTNAGVNDAVQNDAHGMGFVAMNAVRGTKALAIQDGAGTAIVPTVFTVGTEDYPLSRRLFLYSPTPARHRVANDFVTFATSEEGQSVVGDAGFVDLRVRARPGEPCSAACPRAYAKLVEGQQRLSVNFRFASGAVEPDTRAFRDLDRVVAYLHKHEGARLTLAGFSDSMGAADWNLSVSRERALKVAAAMEARGIHPAQVEGFGEALPVAANDLDAGRQRNRRVEVWIKDPAQP